MSGYASYRLAAFLSRRLPGRTAYWVGLRIADLYYLTHRADREAIISNLKQIYRARGVVPAERTLQGMARKTFQYFGKYLVDFFRLVKLSPSDLRKFVSMEHPEYLEQAFDKGHGVVAVTAHFGNWEIAGAVLSTLGYPVHAVVLPERVGRLETLLRHQRESRGMKIMSVGQSVLGIIRCLQRGGLVGLLADRDFSRRDDRIDFFGRSVRMPIGPAWLSMKSGAPVVPCLLIRQEDDSFLFRFHPPIWPEKEVSMEAIRRKICDVLEREIGERPCQWFIFDDFWMNGTSDHQNTVAL